MIRRIKELLYEEGYTIAGAKKRLQSELEDGRSFAAPEVDGELFTAEGEGEDDVPVIPVEAGPTSLSRPSPQSPRSQQRRAQQVAAHGGLYERAGLESASERAGAAAAVGRGRRECRDVDAVAVATREAARRSRRSSRPGGRTVAAAPRAVDSALSERVETLEHGLRRVLAEVRHLREMLADPSSRPLTLFAGFESGRGAAW